MLLHYLKMLADVRLKAGPVISPTQDMVDQYLVIDEVDGKAKPWNETAQYKNSVKEEDPSALQVGDFCQS